MKNIRALVLRVMLGIAVVSLAAAGAVWFCGWTLQRLPGVAGVGGANSAGRAPRANETPPRPPASTGQAAPSKAPRPRRVRAPFDPIKDNGPIFVDWPTPKAAIVITGRQNGYLEPCGCAGLDRMRGGLSRRHTMLESLRKKGWPVVLLDVGGLSQRFGVQALLKFRIAVEAMGQLRYDAIGLGTADLRFPAAELVPLLAGEGGAPSRFVSANVGLFGLAAEVTQRQQQIQAGGLTIGVTAVLGAKDQREINNPDIEMADPESALAQIVPRLRPTCDLMILLAHADKQESVALAQRFPEFDVVVTAGGPAVPPAEPSPIEGGNALLIEVGERVKDAVVLGVFGKSGRPLRYQRVPLDSRFAPSADMAALMVGYQEELCRLGFDGLGVRPTPHPQRAAQGDFVGSEACAECHEASSDVWLDSGHAKATRTLVELKPPRHFDPECLACHVTGWRPQSYTPYESGYLSLDATPKLTAVGCESCHGPSGAHAAAEAGYDEALKKRLRIGLELDQARAKRQICLVCHDVSNSPDFEFETYWPDVAHYEDK